MAKYVTCLERHAILIFVLETFVIPASNGRHCKERLNGGNSFWTMTGIVYLIDNSCEEIFA